MITIVDYGMGNLGSLLNMFRRIGAQARVAADVADVLASEKLVLPGVGAFDYAMRRLDAIPGLRDALERKATVERVPLLGICLGMQLLLDSSEEGELPGLGWIGGTVRRFPKREGLKVPHMGWNIAQPIRPNQLTAGLASEPRYYFVHSFYVTVRDSEHSLMRAQYGIEFDAAVGRDNIYGVQFHPEKSHRFGMQILDNFSRL